MDEIFQPKQKTEEEIFTPTRVSKIEVSPLSGPEIREKSAVYEEVLDGVPVEQSLRGGKESVLRNKALAILKELNQKITKDTVDSGLREQNLSVEDLISLREGLILKESVPYPEEALFIENTDFTEDTKRKYRLAVSFNNIVRDKIKETNTGIFDTVTEFADIIVSEDLSNFIFNSASDRVAYAKEVHDLLNSNLPEDQIYNRFKEIVDEVSDAGFFTQDNGVYMMNFVGLVAEGGVGTESYVEDINQTASDISTFTALGANVLNRIALFGSKARALKKVEKALKSGDDVTRMVNPSALLPANPNKNVHSGIQLTALEEIESTNRFIDIFRRNKLQRPLTQTEYDAAYDAFSRQISSSLSDTDNRRLVDVEVEVDDFNNYKHTAYLGSYKKEPFRKKAVAEKLARRVDGEVVPALGKEDGKGWLVVLRGDLKVNNLISPTNINEVWSGWLAGLASAPARTTLDNAGAMLRAEGQLSIIHNESTKVYNKARSLVKTEEAGNINHILRKMNDDATLSLRSSPLDASEFSLEYQKRTGKAPRKEVVDFYLVNLELNDADYFFKADGLIKRAVNNGEQMRRVDNMWVRTKFVEPEVVGRELVWDAQEQIFKSIDDIGEGRKIMAIKEGAMKVGGKDILFAVDDNSSFRRMLASDVLGYNPGGPRIYRNSNFFIKQNRDGKIPRAFMSSFSEEEARIAREQFNNIVDSIKDTFGKDIKLDDLKGFSSKEIEDVISVNNDWNIDIETLEDFVKFAEDWDLSINHVDFSPDGETLLNSRTTFVGEDNIRDSILTQTVGPRTNKPLLRFGGTQADTFDPIRAIEQSYVATANRAGNYTYITRAVNGWLKAAEDLKAISNTSDLVGLSPIEKMRQAKISESLKIGRKLASERSLIEFKINQKTADIVAMERGRDALASFVYENVSKRLGEALKDSTILSDPGRALRSVAFHTKLGLFALDQILVQASQAVNIVALGGGLSGIKGTAMVPFVQMSLYNPKMSKILGSVADKVFGLGDGGFEEVVEFIRRSGRNIVDNNIILLDGNETLRKSYLTKALDLGRTPFNYGELIARISGLSTAILEFKSSYKGVDIFSDFAFGKIMNRQDILTARMTTASANKMQKGLMAVPTQFLTYHMRMWEQLLSPQLTKWEKGRLFAAQTFVYGGAGFAAYGPLMDAMVIEGDKPSVLKDLGNMVGVNPDMDHKKYEVLRFGLLDAVLSDSIGADSALSTRIGIGEGMWDLAEKLGEGSFFEVLTGPSGQITYDLFYALGELSNNMFTGNFQYSEEDWIRLGRNITSFNRGYNTWIAAQYNEFRSRKFNSPQTLEDSGDIFLVALGIPLKENEYSFSLYNSMKSEDEYIRNHVENMKKSRRLMMQALEDGDKKLANQYSRDIGTMYQMLTPYNKERVKKWFLKNDDGFWVSIWEKAVSRGIDSPMLEK